MIGINKNKEGNEFILKLSNLSLSLVDDRNNKEILHASISRFAFFKLPAIYSQKLVSGILSRKKYSNFIAECIYQFDLTFVCQCSGFD